MMTKTCGVRLFAVPLLISIACGSALAADLINELKRSSVPDDGIELRVWLGGALRVKTLYRLVKSRDGVSAENIAWANIEHAESDGYSDREARRETKSNRRYLSEERCNGQVVAGTDHMWCKIKIRSDGPWPIVFNDLLPDELRKAAGADRARLRWVDDHGR
jgi:hypothetical protein